MHYVYLLESVGVAGQRYVGETSDLRKRLRERNEGLSPHTRKFAPWKLMAYVAFADVDRARAFERYLKQGSGHAFARRHFWTSETE